MKIPSTNTLKSAILSNLAEALVGYEICMEDLKQDKQLLDSFKTIVLNIVDLHKEVSLAYVEKVNKIPVEQVSSVRTYNKNGRIFGVIDGGKNIDPDS